LTTTHNRKLGGIQAWGIWFLCSAFAIYKFTSQTSYASLNASIAESLSLSLSQISILGSTYTFAFAAMTIFSGVLLDRYGARKTLSIATAMVASGILLFGSATTWLMIIFGQILMGLGGAFGYPGKGYLIRHWFAVGSFGLMFGLSQTLVTFSSAVAQGGIGYMLLRFSWREIMFYGAGFGLVLTLAMALFIRDPDEVLQKPSQSSTGFWQGIYNAIKEVVSDRQIWVWALLGSMVFGTIMSINVLWGVKLLIARDFDATTAGTVNASMWFGYALGGPMVALLCNRLKSFKVPLGFGIVGLLLTTLGLLKLPDLSLYSAYALYVSLGLFGATAIISFIVTTKICRDVVAGTALGIVNAIMFFAVGILLWLPARIIGNVELTINSIEKGMLFLPVALGIALFSLLFVKDIFNSSSHQYA
jgi:MFS family permease